MLRALTIVGLLLGSTTAVFAQSADGAKLFEEGRILAKDGNYAEACDKFAKSLELDPAPGTKLNYADCHEHLGHLAQAYRLFIEVAQADKTANPDRAKFAQGRADGLADKLGTVVVKLAAPDAAGTSVTIAGRIVPVAPEIREMVDPGDVTVETKAPNAAPFSRTAAARAGATVVVEVPAPNVQIEPATQTTTVRRHTNVVIAYTLGGAGAASLTTGVLMGLVARSRYNAQIDNGNCSNQSPPQCNPDGYKAQGNAVTLANVGTVFGIAGLAMIAGGAVVFLTAPRDLVVTPTASTQSAGLTVVGTF